MSGESKERGPGYGLIRVGLVLFAVGVLAIVVTFAGYVDGVDNRPVWQNLICMLAPLGFGLAVWGLVRAGRSTQREALRRSGGH